MIKILMISTNPIGKDGITSVIFNIINNINVKYFQIDVLAINNPDNEYKIMVESKGGKLYSLHRDKHHMIKYISNLKTLIKKNKYDIVHVHGNSHTLTLELMIAKHAGCKTRIAHSHNTTCKAKVLNKLLTPFFLHYYTTAIACGNVAGEWMFGHHQFQIINNGINIENFKFNQEARQIIRSKLGIDNNTILLCNVGRFNEQKNHVFLIKILSQLIKKHEDYRLLLIGDGKLQHETKKQVIEYNLEDKVIFLGTTNEIGNYLSSCDLIVMPSLYEGFPVTLVEQQVNGLQCVVSDVITRDVDKTGSITFVPLNDNPDYWAKVITGINISLNRERLSQENSKIITNAGLDIAHEIIKLEMLYKKEYEKI